MIDWPNLIAGFVLGLVPTGIGWLRSRKKLREDLGHQWLAAARELEIVSWRPDLTSGALHAAQVGYPLDHWRGVVGGSGFVLFDQMSGALQNAEGMSAPVRTAADAERANVAVQRFHEARIAFANWVRGESSQDYSKVVTRERQAQYRRAFVRHP